MTGIQGVYVMEGILKGRVSGIKKFTVYQLFLFCCILINRMLKDHSKLCILFSFDKERQIWEEQESAVGVSVPEGDGAVPAAGEAIV